MLKKAGMLTVGVTAGLLAVAPLANAGVSNNDNDDVKGHSSKKDDGDRKDHKDRNKKHDDGDQKGNGNIKCENSSGDRETVPSEDAALADVLGAGALNDNTGNLLSCNSIANGNAVSVSLLGDSAAVPEI